MKVKQDVLVSKFKKFVREFACAANPCRPHRSRSSFERYTEKDGKTDVNSSLWLSVIIPSNMMRC